MNLLTQLFWLKHLQSVIIRHQCKYKIDRRSDVVRKICMFISMTNLFL